MSSVTTTRTKFSAEDARVYHPLDRLRGIIRRYVVIEGILSTAIFLVAWYGLAMLLDYGIFKAFTWDWVQDSTRWIRVAALVAALAVMASIVIYRIVKRLTTELTYPALALVLERRFPKVLGDRLITAVELADVPKAAKYGYSADMIRQTISEARELVGTVPVNDVFNWRRLRVMAAIAVGGVLAMIAAGFACHALATRSFDPVRAGWKMVHVSTILAERDLLLWNTPWPRRALLQLDPSIKETGIRVARDGKPPLVKVKSFRWVIADRSSPDGWRPLLWSDIDESFVGVPVPQLPYASLRLPDDKGVLSSDAEDWTVDAVWERAIENAAVRDKLSNAMGGDQYVALQQALDRLEMKASEPANGRKLRHLDRPENVSFEYVGARTGGGGTLNAEGNSEYAGEIGGLREDVTFVIKAEDYRTPPRSITLIPPPALVKLSRVEYQPAYLYYSPPLVPNPERPGEMMLEGPASLKGKLQRKPEEKITLTGDSSPLVVPSGSEVVITAVTELPIVSAFARPRIGKVPGAKEGSAAMVPLPLIDENTFVIEFRDKFRLTSKVEFDLVFRNADNVESTRTVSIQVLEDNAPVVEVAPEFIRRVGNLYYVTPRAKIPFNPESIISDDHGLSKVEYRATYWPEDSPLARAIRCSNVTRTIMAPVLGTSFQTGVQGVYNASTVRALDKGESRLEASFLVRSFFDLSSKIVPETRVRMEQLLQEPLDRPHTELVQKMFLKSNLRSEVTHAKSSGLLESFQWKIEGDYFDLKSLNLEVPAGDIQPRYMVELNVAATDSNYDTGPKSTANAEVMKLLVISSGDLLFEISKDLETLALKVDEAIKKIEAARRKYEFVRSKNGIAGLEEIDPVKVRARDIGQDVAKARESILTVVRELRRIEKECIYNQLEERNILEYGSLANQVDRLLGETPQPVTPNEDALMKNGEFARKANFPATDKLLTLLQTTLDDNRWAEPDVVIGSENALKDVETELRAIRLRMGERESIEKVKLQVNMLLEKQRRAKKELQDYMIYLAGILIKDFPDISSVGPLSLVKGEAKKIKHSINWRQYKEDNLNVKVSSSDPAGLVVPEELKLDFEKNDIAFEYEIRATNKAGDYTITLAPAVGPKVEVKVTVK